MDLNNSLLLKACRREKTPRPPIWLMRQAGRYMKEYRDLRAKVSFLELCKNSDLAAQVTVEAAEKLGVDAAIIFSDILLPVEPMGFQLSYENKEGPVIGNPLRSKDDLKNLKPMDGVDSVGFVFEAIRKTKAALKPDIPLIGFVGAPFTLASYIIEGKSSQDFQKTKKLMKEDPQTWQSLLNKIVDFLIPFLNEQIRSGASVVQIFDSWVGNLSKEDYVEKVLPHSKRLIENITRDVPVIHFGTKTSPFLSEFASAGGDVIGVDWRIHLDKAWEQIGERAMMGNLDPNILLTTTAEIKIATKEILKQVGGKPGHIFNLGHGVLPQTPVENVQLLIETVKNGTI